LTKLAEQFEAQKKGQQSEVGDVIKEQNSAIKGKDSGSIYPELSEPHLVLESPAGIETTTRKSTHISSEAHTALTTGKNLSIVAGDSFFASIRQAARIFVHKLGLKMIAAAGDIDIKALSDSVNILAKLNITQTAETIKISASKEVLIDGGGSYTRWNAGGVEQGTSGSHTSHAGNHTFVGAKNVDTVHQKDFEKAKPKKYSQKLFVDEEIRNLATGPITYKFFSASNVALGAGTLDGGGKSQPLFTDTAQSVHVQVDVNGGKWTQLLDDRHESIPIPSTSQMIVFDYPEHGDGVVDSDDTDEDEDNTVEQA
jgi:type VI secretion system secreted protein VgrG